MKPERINQLIAEHCGWKIKEGFEISPKGMPYRRLAENQLHHFPNYCGDLNAMHEAENFVSKELRYHYIDILGDSFGDSWEFCTATAPQRAEAFLKTLGKWENE